MLWLSLFRLDYKIPIPQKYITERDEKIRKAHKVSGFNSLRARIVQGGKADGKK